VKPHHTGHTFEVDGSAHSDGEHHQRRMKKMKLHLQKGALHKDLGVAEGEKIPEVKIQRALHSKSKKLRKRAQFAENAKHWHHG